MEKKRVPEVAERRGVGRTRYYNPWPKSHALNRLPRAGIGVLGALGEIILVTLTWNYLAHERSGSIWTWR